MIQSESHYAHLFKSVNLLPKFFNLSPTIQRPLRMVPANHQPV